MAILAEVIDEMEEGRVKALLLRIATSVRANGHGDHVAGFLRQWSLLDPDTEDDDPAETA